MENTRAVIYDGFVKHRQNSMDRNLDRLENTYLNEAKPQLDTYMGAYFNYLCNT